MHSEFENGRSFFWDGFILLVYKSLGKKEIVNKHHQSCVCPFKIQNKAVIRTTVVFPLSGDERLALRSRINWKYKYFKRLAKVTTLLKS